MGCDISSSLACAFLCGDMLSNWPPSSQWHHCIVGQYTAVAAWAMFFSAPICSSCSSAGIMPRRDLVLQPSPLQRAYHLLYVAPLSPPRNLAQSSEQSASSVAIQVSSAFFTAHISGSSAVAFHISSFFTALTGRSRSYYAVYHDLDIFLKVRLHGFSRDMHGSRYLLHMYTCPRCMRHPSHIFAG